MYICTPYKHTQGVNTHVHMYIIICIPSRVSYRGVGNLGFPPPQAKVSPPQAEVPLPPNTAHQIELLDSFVMGTLCPLEDELWHIY